MKMLKKVYTVVMITLFLLPFISLAFAADKKEVSYGGLNNNDIYVYLTTFDNKPLEKYFEKEYLYDGFDEETAKELAADTAESIFESLQYDKDIEAIKYNIITVETDKEEVGNYNSRKVWYSSYISENRDANEWELRIHEDYLRIMEYQEKLYKDFVSSLAGMNIPFIAKGIEWNRLASAVDKELDKDYDGHAGARKLNDGIQTYAKVIFGSSSVEAEKFRATSRYTSKGVLYYYEWTYGDEIIAKFELEQWFYSEMWILMLVVLTIAGAIFIVLLRRDLKR